jgi:predicted nucleotidyltransferase
MEQNISFEIILLLMQKSNHVRSIAKELKINHMTVSRVLKKLYEENVVDFNEEGKNKSYFLKKSLEGKNYCYMAEIYKLSKLIDKYPKLRMTVESIQRRNDYSVAVLFGSYAKGIPREESDIDIYIDTEDRNIRKEIELSDSKASVKIGKYDTNSLLIKEIWDNHVILKGIEEYYVKQGFFGGNAS